MRHFHCVEIHWCAKICSVLFTRYHLFIPYPHGTFDETRTRRKVNIRAAEGRPTKREEDHWLTFFPEANNNDIKNISQMWMCIVKKWRGGTKVSRAKILEGASETKCQCYRNYKVRFRTQAKMIHNFCYLQKKPFRLKMTINFSSVILVRWILFK